MTVRNNAVCSLLQVALRHRISEPSFEEGFARFHSLAVESLGLTEFADAVAACLREGLIQEPVRLPEGALQCHWHLELTAKGVAMACPLVMAGKGRPSTT